MESILLLIKHTILTDMTNIPTLFMKYIHGKYPIVIIKPNEVLHFRNTFTFSYSLP